MLSLPRAVVMGPSLFKPERDVGFDQSSGFDPTDPEPIPQIEFDQSLPD